MPAYRLQFSCGSGSQVCYYSIAAASADGLDREFHAFAANSQIVSMLFIENAVLKLELHDESVTARDARPALVVDYEDGRLTTDERGFPVGLGIEVPAGTDEWELAEWLMLDPTAEERLMFTEPESVSIDPTALGLPLLDGDEDGDHVVLTVDGAAIKHPWGLVGDMTMGHTFEPA